VLEHALLAFFYYDGGGGEVVDFVHPTLLSPTSPRQPGESFLVLFFKKEQLAYLMLRRGSALEIPAWVFGYDEVQVGVGYAHVA
jgi:hypothetical protein